MKRAVFVLALAVMLASCSNVLGLDDLQERPTNLDSSEAGADAPQVNPPPGCDLSVDPKDAPKCVDDSVGVFVDGTAGDDTNPGTRVSPFRSIDFALRKLAGRPRIYVCEGTYLEHVRIARTVEIYGGFACVSWSYSGNKPKVAPLDPGFALNVNGVSSGAVVLADLAFESVAGTASDPSSIAALVKACPNVKFLRVELTAGAGADGARGEDGTVGTSVAPDGNNATGPSPANAKTCQCANGGTTTGGAGGVGGTVGEDGAPALPENPAGHTGKAGVPTGGACKDGNTGRAGADAAATPAGASSTVDGALMDAQPDPQWVSQTAKPGANGGPGQGGGGGCGGGPFPGYNDRAAGGGGGCGGCGGTGAMGGTGGGGSIALLTIDSSVHVAQSTLSTVKGGAGGAGGAGGPGGAGGKGGSAWFSSYAYNACDGGHGGSGATGGGGGGGAGGVSVGVLYKNGAPALDGVTFSTGRAGGGGLDGNGTAKGVDGRRADTIQID